MKLGFSSRKSSQQRNNNSNNNNNNNNNNSSMLGQCNYKPRLRQFLGSEDWSLKAIPYAKCQINERWRCMSRDLTFHIFRFREKKRRIFLWRAIFFKTLPWLDLSSDRGPFMAAPERNGNGSVASIYPVGESTPIAMPYPPFKKNPNLIARFHIGGTVSSNLWGSVKAGKTTLTPFFHLQYFSRYPPKVWHSPWKMMVGRRFFPMGVMLNVGRVSL